MNSFLNPLLNPALANVPPSEIQRHFEGRAGIIWSSNDLRSCLDRLIQICQDGHEAYAQAAELAQSDWLRSQFLLYAKQREQFAVELANIINGLGVEPSSGNSLGSVLQRAWLELQTAVTGGAADDSVLLEELERGENTAKQAYEAEVDRGLPEHIHHVVYSQYQDVLRVHREVCELRDSYPG